MDVRELTTVTDYMVVASGRSERQVRSLADHVISQAKAGFVPLGTEGHDTGEWVLVDLGDAVVHVMNLKRASCISLKNYGRSLRDCVLQADLTSDEADSDAGDRAATAEQQAVL